jgi:hypothetical protein
MSNQVDEMARQEAEEKRTQGPQTYVIQIARNFDGITHQGPIWEDIATVEVPPRTPRKKAIKQALAEAGIGPSEKRPKLRALDVDSFETHEPEAHQPPMEWRL